MKNKMITCRPGPSSQLTIASLALLVAALAIVGCTPPALVRVQIEYDLAPESMPNPACSNRIRPPPDKPQPQPCQPNPGPKVLTWVDGDLFPRGETQKLKGDDGVDKERWNGFAKGPAKVDVYITNENPFCTSYRASMNGIDSPHPDPLPGAIISSTPASGVAAGKTAAEQISVPMAESRLMVADLMSAFVTPKVMFPSDKAKAENRAKADKLGRDLDSASTLLSSAQEGLTNLKKDLAMAADGVSTIAQYCKPQPTSAGGSSQSLKDGLQKQMDKAEALSDQKKTLTTALATVTKSIDSADQILLSIPFNAKQIELAGVQQNDLALIRLARALGSVSVTLSAEMAALRGTAELVAKGDATQSGSQTQSLATVAKSLDTVEAALNRANTNVKNGRRLDSSQVFSVNQKVTVDLVNDTTGGNGNSDGSSPAQPTGVVNDKTGGNGRGVEKVTFYTLSPLYIDVGVGPAFIFSSTQTWSVSSSPGSTLGTVTHSDQPNLDGVVSLSGYWYEPRYYDGSVRYRVEQLIPRPMLGLSMKSAFSSVYAGLQIDPIQFVDITLGAYFYSKPEPVNARDGAVVPTGTLATQNAFAITGFISVTSSVNLFATWLTGLAKSAVP